MSDTYGSGLNFGAPDAVGGAPLDITPAPQAPSFGSALRDILPGPHYDAPDPATSPLDQTADLLSQRVKRANEIATNPLAQFFAPDRVQAAREFVPKATEQLQKIQQQKSAIQAGHAQAQTLGLQPGEVSDQATQDDRLTIASAKALKGDMRAFQGIQAIAPDRAAAIAPQVYETVAGHLGKAQLAFDSLSSMENEGQYRAKVNQLRQDGTLTDLESLGLKLPPTFEAFSAVKASEGRALREARIGINTIGQKLEEQNTYQPMEKKEAETYAGRLTTVYGDEAAGGAWSRNAASGTRGKVFNGLPVADALGRGGVLGNADQRKELGEEMARLVPKDELEKFRSFNRTYALAEPTAEQKKRGDVINTNPNVQQGIAEGLASMLRGGKGGATQGLLNIETGKRGVIQGIIDKIRTEYGGAINTIGEKDVKPYLTHLTQVQQREVLDGLKQWNDRSLDDRAMQIARRAGALGFDADAIGLGKKEANGAIQAAIEEGRQAQIERMRPHFQAIGGGDGVLQLGAQRPGAGAAPLPTGAQRSNQLPGTQPLLTPVQQSAQTPNAPVPPSPPDAGASPGPPALNSNGGPGTPPAAPQPVTIAGQQVAMALPSGASPTYPQAAQRIESGNERSPWSASAKGSSASGAFQFIDKTWAENKPAGAPDRAKDATPAQQAEAFASLTAKNAASLSANRLPVTDANLYVMHNLGAGAGATLLQASPTADARSLVGEAAARNNPMFFKGRPTVATVLQRYQDAMNGTGAAPTAKPNLGEMTVADFAGSAAHTVLRASPPTAMVTAIWDQLTPSQKQTVKDAATEYAPAIGSTAGAIGGGMLGGPVGAVGGGAAGGAAGQSVKDYLQGKAQNPREMAKQAALGGVLGVASEARPLAAVAGRVLGAAGVEAGDAALKGDTVDAVDAGVKGLAYGLGGEALGRFVSSAGAGAYKALSRYTTSAQHELSAQAGKLAEARQVLASEQPKLPGDAGPNPKYDAAKKQADDATQAIKDHGQNPDDMVHAYEQAAAGVSAGEAAVMRGAAAEKRNVSEGYNQLRQDVRDTGVGAPKPNQPLPDGPLAQLRTANNMAGKVPEQFRPEAEHAEMLLKAPAKDWGQKWQQMQNAGTELIEKRMAFLANGDKPSAKAMDSLFEGVRAQQKAVASYVFGPKRGAEVIANLESLDQRYARVMNATKGMSYEKMQSVLASGNTPERRELEKSFREFAKGDPSAIRAFNAMKAGARGDWKTEAQLMTPVIAGEVAANLSGVPTIGAISALVGGHRLYKMVQGYMNAKVLGKAVTFKDFLTNEIKTGNRVSDAAGATGARLAVQGAAQ